MRSELGKVETEDYMYPKLMADNEGGIWLMGSEDKGFAIRRDKDTLGVTILFKEEYGPLTDFHGSVTLSND